MKSTTIGIDLGTTTSCVAGYPGNNLDIIVNKEGERITPSVVCYDQTTGIPVVGSNAILAASANPYNFIFEVKRMLGKGFHHKDIQTAKAHWPFALIEIKTTGKADKDATDNIGIEVVENGKKRVYEPIQISAAVLNYLYESAKTRLGTSPTFVAITVPAYFSDSAKQRTLDAAKIAFSGKKDDNNNDLDVKIVLLAEPTAAAIAYGSILLKSGKVANGAEQTVLVFDLGGGTFDVSILDFSFDQESPVGLVKAIDGDNFLGGSDFDNIIIDMAKEHFAATYPDHQQLYDKSSKEEMLKAHLRLRDAAIRVKNSLSSNLSANFSLTCYLADRDINFTITRVNFERKARALFNRLKVRVEGVLLASQNITPCYNESTCVLDEPALRRDSNNVKTIGKRSIQDIINSAKNDIHKVIMVGGASRMPKVKSLLEDFFNETADTHPDKKKVVAPLNPDEAVAYGAAYYAKAVCPDASDDDAAPKLLLIDQVPLNLNIETMGGVATKIIEARTAIPCNSSQIFSTAEDNQSSVRIVITQGNRSISSENFMIGEFTLSGIAPAPRGQPQIEISFDVDQNNILKVTAVDKATGAKQIYVQNMTNKLSDADIERMKKEAEAHSAADAAFTERINLKNTFEAMIFNLEDKVAEMQIPEESKTEMKSLLSTETAWLNSISSTTTPAEIQGRMDSLNAKIQSLMQESPSSGRRNTNTTDAAAPSDVEEVN